MARSKKWSQSMSDQAIYDDGHRHVVRLGKPTAGGAYAHYQIRKNPDVSEGGAGHQPKVLDNVHFQHDTIPLVGVVGHTNEVQLAMVIDRLEFFQAGEFACETNAVALEHCRAALGSLEARTADRQARGVEGEHKA